MRGKLAISLAVIGLTQSGCTVLPPELPSDPGLPMKEILMNATCELQDSLRFLDQKQFGRFKPRQWVVNVTVLPKVNNEVSGGVGYSGKSASVPTKYSTSWLIGSGPGLNVDARGQRDAGVTYTMKSLELITTRKLACDYSSPNYHALAQYLGVGRWLVRTATAMEQNPVVELDKPNYNSEVTIKFAGDGSFSYAYPFGGASASLSGSYSLDEQLQISLLPLDPPPVHYQITTLPVGDLPKSVVTNRATVSAVQAARQRGDIVQLDATLRSLRQVP